MHAVIQDVSLASRLILPVRLSHQLKSVCFFSPDSVCCGLSLDVIWPHAVPGRSYIQCPLGCYCPNSPYLCASYVCPAGRYTSQPSMSACTPCPQGTYNQATTQAGCTPCPAGQYQPNQGYTSTWRALFLVCLCPSNVFSVYACSRIGRCLILVPRVLSQTAWRVVPEAIPRLSLVRAPRARRAPGLVRARVAVPVAMLATGVLLVRLRRPKTFALRVPILARILAPARHAVPATGLAPARHRRPKTCAVLVRILEAGRVGVRHALPATGVALARRRRPKTSVRPAPILVRVPVRAFLALPGTSVLPARRRRLKRAVSPVNIRCLVPVRVLHAVPGIRAPPFPPQRRKPHAARGLFPSRVLPYVKRAGWANSRALWDNLPVSCVPQALPVWPWVFRCVPCAQRVISRPRRATLAAVSAGWAPLPPPRVRWVVQRVRWAPLLMALENPCARVAVRVVMDRPRRRPPVNCAPCPHSTPAWVFLPHRRVSRARRAATVACRVRRRVIRV